MGTGVGKMADSDKELGALRALKEIECKHTPSLLASVVESVMNNLTCRFLPPSCRDVRIKKRGK